MVRKAEAPVPFTRECDLHIIRAFVGSQGVVPVVGIGRGAGSPEAGQLAARRLRGTRLAMHAGRAWAL